MAVYIVALRRTARGREARVRDVLAMRPGVKIRPGSSRDVVVIEASPGRVSELQRELGSAYRIEPEVLHVPLC
jgi:hypothetical protein